MRLLALSILASLLSACANPWMGRNLPEGTSMSEVEAKMGKPAEKITDASGRTVWFYPTAPGGRDTWAANFQPDGRLASVEQRLTKDNISRIQPGTTTQKQVRELFGSPWKSYQLARLPYEEWDYRVLVDNRKFDYLIRFSSDGIVR